MALRFFDEFPQTNALESTTSDADGHFRVTPRSDGAILVASTKRTVDGRDEVFNWMLPSDRWPTPLFLSNNNVYDPLSEP